MQKKFALALLLLAVGAFAAGEWADAAPSQTRYALHIAKLKAKLPRGVFTYVVEPPFVVIGDGTPQEVAGHARDTVGWAVRMLRQAYFARDPELLDIYLFKDKQSYEGYNRLLFKHEPETPFGYYSAANKALVMNISTGGGTLVHEIVHSFIDVNFAGCPTWFNEGLASLYEQCGERDGKIVGFPNWRLPGLKEAITAGKTPTIEALSRMDQQRFYADKGVNYGMARYLCYYLQQQGLLKAYYDAFAKNRATDPTGYATLRQVLGERDMKSFQKRWEGFVMSLSYP